MDKERLLLEQTNELLTDALIMSQEVQDTLTGKADSIKNFIVEHKDVGTAEMEERELKHKESQELWNSYTNYLRDAEYNLRITGKEFHYLRSHIVTKKAYDESTLFIGLKIKEDYFDLIPLDDIPNTNVALDNLKIQINHVTLIHHLIKDMTVVNLNDNKTIMYANILAEIGNISKIFNKFNAESEALSKEIYTWTIGLEPEERQKVVDDLNKIEEAKAAGETTDVEEVDAEKV